MPASFSSLVNAPSPCYDADPHRGSGLENRLMRLFSGAAPSRLGSVAEWFKALVLKTSDGASRPWVRIPPLPPPLLPSRG